MVNVVHLTAKAVQEIHAVVLKRHGGMGGLRDEGLLLSAVAATQATWRGKPLLCDAIEAAAGYLVYLCKNHPFNDGNKRTALAACLVVLHENGVIQDTTLPPASLGAWEELTLEVAAGKLDREQAAARLRSLARRPKSAQNG